VARNSKRKTRRPKGEGTEWQDKTTKHWRWRIRWEGRSYSVSDIDRHRAAEECDRLKASLKKRINVADGKQTLTAFAALWFESIRRDIGATTYSDYQKRYRLFISGPLGDYRLCDLDAKTIRKWLNATRDHYAFSSAKQARALLERILDLAVEDKLIEENPASLVKPPKPVRKPDSRDDEEGQHALSMEHVAQLLAEARRTDAIWSTARGQTLAAANAVRSEGLYLLYTLAVRTGLRRGELLGLRWIDIDLDQKLLRVRQQVRRTDTGYEISDTLKTPRARRTVPLTDREIALLREYKLRMGARGHGLLFPDKAGGPRDPQSITRNFARLVKRLGLGDYHLHDLRHTFITMMRTAGVDLEVLGDLAGHEHTDTTANIYSDADLDRKRAAMEKLG
jgi:integrase